MSASLLIATVILPVGFFLLAWGLFSLRVSLPAAEVAASAPGQDWAAPAAVVRGPAPGDLDWREDPDEIKLRQSLITRMLLPVVRNVARVVRRYTPVGLMETLAKRLTAAGGLWGLTADGLVAAQVVLAAAGAVLGLSMTGLLGLAGTQAVFLTVVLAIAGFMFPLSVLNTRLRKRKLEISEALPNALDLLTIGIEAGLTFDAAIQQVTIRYKNALTTEFRIMLGELNLGRTRDQALASVAERADVDDLRPFVQAVIQSTETGGSLGQILRVQAGEARRLRRQRAQERGAKAPIKMILPMVGCIFPAIFVVLLGPSVIIVGHALLGQ